MHSVLDMLLMDRSISNSICASNERYTNEYPIEIDRTGDYIELNNAKHID